MVNISRTIMKKELLTEMPWIGIEALCPYDDMVIPDVVDYHIEDWYIPLTFKDFFFNKDEAIKGKFINKIFKGNRVPVLCPNPECPGKVFVYDRKMKLAIPRMPSRRLAELLINNREKIYSALYTTKENIP